MPTRKKGTVLFFLVTVLFLWGCSSHRPPVEQTTSPVPAEQNSEVSQPVETKPQKETPPAKTIIPPEEKAVTQEELDQEKNSNNEKEGASVLLEEALNYYQEAQQAWEKGDPESALAALDEAYRTILRAEIPADSPLANEKNDLRLLIAQKIQAIHASRLVPVGENRKTIPLVENKDVFAEVQSFQSKERKEFEEAYKRSGLYQQMIAEELRTAGLPEELSWLPIIESGFKVRAYSRARALGLWQFISSTGYRYGLKLDRWVDERMDPLKSTRAAIKYLTELHSFFGDWTTALAAYNCGEYRIQYVIRTQQVDYLDNFWDLYRRLPYETARFVPRFIATLLILNAPEKYGLNLPQPYAALKYETVTVKQAFKLSSLSSNLGLDSSELAFLNPELRYDATPDYPYELKVPVGYSEKVLSSVASLPRWIPPEASYSWHTVRSGETLSTIARRYKTSVRTLAKLNNLRSPYLLRIKQRLKIPGKAGL